jgi:hypothetical protein
LKVGETTVTGVGGKMALIGVGKIVEEEEEEVVVSWTASSPLWTTLPSPLGTSSLARFDLALCGGESSVSSDESARRRFARRFVFTGVTTMFGGTRVFLRFREFVVLGVGGTFDEDVA